jgi:LysM repeat protein
MQGVHVVQPGETLYRIGLQYNVDYRQIAQWNNIPPPYNLSVGQRLVVSEPSTVGSTMPAPAPTTPPPAQPVPQPPSGNMQYHTVAKGDTLYSIARRYGRSFQELAAWNGISAPYTLSVGQQLIVSGGSGGYQPTQPTIVTTPPPSTAPTTGASYHTVSAGETLYSIARRYGRSFQELASWNNISSPYTLNIGQRLIVSPTSSAASYGTFSSRSYAPNNYAGWAVYVVRKGDTLYEIAQRYRQNYRNIAQWNGLRPPYRLMVGQRLYVGPPGTAQTAPPPAQRTPVMTASTPQVMTTMSAPPTPNNAVKTYHTVQAGESLATIAERYGQTQHELALWNGLRPPFLVQPGQSLMVIQ